MKRILGIVAGLVALLVAAYTGRHLGAKTEAPARPVAAPTRVALLNMPYVVKNYDKYKQFMKDMLSEEKKYVDQIKQKKTVQETKSKILQDPTLDAVKKDALEKEVRNLQREVEDLTAEARKAMTTKGTDMMVLTYKEIRNAAQRYAKANHFDLVLHFADGTTPEEINSPQAIVPKMQAGGCIPLYWNPSLDISGHVLKSMNDAYKQVQARRLPADSLD